ncbi:MAG: PKD domain-containing protein [Candidatus Cloacimonadia bacterium]
MKRLILITALLFLTASMLIAEQVERDMVVLEIFTATWCGYCPGAAMGAEDLIANGCDVAVIEYHPSNSDPFYNTYAASRMGYYGSAVGGYPTAIFDGVLTVVGGSPNQSMYSYYLPRYNARKAINSSFTIEVEGEHTGLDYNVTLTATKVAETTSTDMVLHLVLTESHIPYHWQNQDSLHWVERLMVPNQYGTPLDFSADSTNVVSLSFTLDPNWIADNCELTAFIQDTNTKEILQGTKVSLPDLLPPIDADFSADITSGEAPLTVNFLDQSTSGSPIISWYWDFGDGGTSTEENPTYIYEDPGTYTVSLTVINEAINVDTEIKEDFITVISTGMAEDDSSLPSKVTLKSNHPNPFNKETIISYGLPKPDKVELQIYNIKGQLVQTLVNDNKPAGNHTVEWNAENMSSGIYFYKLSTNDTTFVKRMLLMR